MTYKDSIKWLEALKREIGQVQHRDLWHFEEAIDEIIIKLEPLAKPHGRLIDANRLVWFIDNHIASGKKWVEFETIKDMINSLPIIIEAEASE